MRDPNRIPKLLNALGQVWMKNPDLRLGQIVINASYFGTAKDDISDTGTDPFYVEDDEMLEGLKKLTEKSS